jgi:hypothetical protein
VFDTGDKVVARENGNSARRRASRLEQGSPAFHGGFPPAPDHSRFDHSGQAAPSLGESTTRFCVGMTLAAVIVGAILIVPQPKKL